MYCSACNQDKSEEEFSWRIKGKRRQSQCKPCLNAYNRTHYSDNKQYYVSKAKDNKAEIRDLVRNAKQRPCTDCGIEYPYYVMDFDHRPDTDKKFTIGESTKVMGKQQAIAEIAKCDVVCSNCHRIRTFKRLSESC